MQRYPMRIGGEQRWTGRSETIRNPYDGEPIGEVAVGTARDLDEAIAAASRAFEKTRRMPTHRRASILQSIASSLEQQSDDFARLIAQESGKPIRFCRGEVKRAVVTFTLAAEEARRLGGEVMPIDLEPRSEGRLCLYQRVPRGPVAALSPFNFPLNLAAHKVAPALAVGASLVLKPPPQCPLTAHRLAQLCSQAGLPPGGFNVVHCPPDVAQRMVEDDRLAVLSFTGSDAVGWKLKSLAGKKQVLLELGGNAPCVVDEDVDLDAALPKIVTGAWANAGQVCIKVQRLLVHRQLFDEFVDRFVAATREIPCGDPLDEKTIVGPLIEKKHVERVLSWIAQAKGGGAKVHCGGRSEGQIVTPAVLSGVPHDQRVYRDEVFGPVTVVEPFDKFEQALQLCNDTRFGLQAGVFTGRIDRALEAFDQLAYGGVMINEVPTFRVDNFPYGGTRDSGHGREGVRFAVEELTEPKTLVIAR